MLDVDSTMQSAPCIDPKNMSTSFGPPSPPSSTCTGPSDSSSSTTPKKKRKSWGQVLPKPTTNLPPRKRAKTEEEKAQRLYERVQRNRQAAHNSRMRKQDEMDNVQRQNDKLKQENAWLTGEIERLREDNARLNALNGSGISIRRPASPPPDFHMETIHVPAPPSLTDGSSVDHPSSPEAQPQSPPSPQLYSPLAADCVDVERACRLDGESQWAGGQDLNFSFGDSSSSEYTFPTMAHEPSAFEDIINLDCVATSADNSSAPMNDPLKSIWYPTYSDFDAARGHATSDLTTLDLLPSSAILGSQVSLY